METEFDEVAAKHARDAVANYVLAKEGLVEWWRVVSRYNGSLSAPTMQRELEILGECFHLIPAKPARSSLDAVLDIILCIGAGDFTAVRNEVHEHFKPCIDEAELMVSPALKNLRPFATNPATLIAQGVV